MRALVIALSLLLLTSCFGETAIINDADKDKYVKQNVQWRSFFDYFDKYVKTEIDDLRDNVRSVRESVSRALNKLMDYPYGSKSSADVYIESPKVPLAIVHFVTKRLTLAGAQNIAKAYTQTVLAGHTYVVAYFIPYQHPYPDQYNRDLEVLRSLLPESMNSSIITVDASTVEVSENESVDTIPDDVSHWDIDALAALAFAQFRNGSNNTNPTPQPTYYWFVDSELTWLGSLPHTLAKWSYLRSDVHLALGCRDVRGDSTINSSSRSDPSCSPKDNVCSNSSSSEGGSRVLCHPQLSRHTPALLANIAEQHKSIGWRSLGYTAGASIARSRRSKRSDLLDLDWNDLFMGCWGRKKRGVAIPVVSHVIEAYNSAVKAVFRHKWDDDMVYRAYDNKVLRFVLQKLTRGALSNCTTQREFRRMEEQFTQGLFRGKPGIIFRNITVA